MEPPKWFKVAVGIAVVVEWVALGLAAGLLVWTFLSWVSSFGSCTGIVCW